MASETVNQALDNLDKAVTSVRDAVATQPSISDAVHALSGGAIDLYRDTNALYKDFGFYKQPTIYAREINGDIRETSKQRNYLELATASKGRSGEQRDIFEAAFPPASIASLAVSTRFSAAARLFPTCAATLKTGEPSCCEATVR